MHVFENNTVKGENDMKIYTIRYTDSMGHPRIESVSASSAVEALRRVQPNEGEIVEQIIERE